MKKAFLLAGLFLCAGAAEAQETPLHQIADGRKRNEAAYEQSLEKTGWKNESIPDQRKTPVTPAQKPDTSSSPAKSS